MLPPRPPPPTHAPAPCPAQAFLAYCDPLLYVRQGRKEMDIVGFCRLLRDCRLLDNRLSLLQADVIFTRVDAAADADTIPGVRACGLGGWRHTADAEGGLWGAGGW
jgi:hypothetical protein